uniref:Uncharacterized protein n=1 Tax=Bos mutus grunniens TaxID=30521 RepID=A0A8C0A2V0_BOSMU
MVQAVDQEPIGQFCPPVTCWGMPWTWWRLLSREPPPWDLSAQQIAELTTELIEQTKRVYDRVGAQEPQDVSYENTLKALADVEVSYTGERWIKSP